eukprot:m.172012 g.172012  ORF g.172012 m.172012 type:complete len:325 (+) comp14826_c0_seq1:78-1052(+)
MSVVGRFGTILAITCLFAIIAPSEAGGVVSAIRSFFGFGRRRVQYVFVPDPEALRKLEEKKQEVNRLNIEVRDLQQELARFENSSNLIQVEEDLFTRLINSDFIKPFYNEHIIVGTNINVAFVGAVSSGKSTTINALSGKKVAETGLGTTTIHYEKKASTVRDGVTVNFFDVPGEDKEFSYIDTTLLQWFRTMHVIVITTETSVTSSDRVIRIAQALGKHVIFLRNLKIVPRVDEDNLDKVKEADATRIEQNYGIPKNVQHLYTVSSLNMFDVKMAIAAKTAIPDLPIYDWDLFESHLFSATSALFERYGGQRAQSEHNEKPEL